MDNRQRQTQIMRTSILGIVINLCIALLKFVVGGLTGSLAIVSEGVNNLTDASSSFLTLAGTKLSAKHPDKKHPFGYGRIEYLTGLIVGGLMLYAGITLFIESIDGIIHPSEMSITVISIVLVALSAVVKILLGLYTIRIGKKTNSDALIGIGKESRNDALMSVVTIASSVIFLLAGFSLDAYAGLVFSFLVLKSAYETLRDTLSDLIGRPGETELAHKLYHEIRSTEGIVSAADMMLHNYGPDRWSGSVNVEIDHKKNLGEVYESLHALQLHIMHEYKVTMVFGIYAVDNDSPHSKELRRYITDFVHGEEHVKSFHALYISEDTNTLYCDLMVDYADFDWNALSERFKAYIAKAYPKYKIELTVETDFV